MLVEADDRISKDGGESLEGLAEQLCECLCLRHRFHSPGVSSIHRDLAGVVGESELEPRDRFTDGGLALRGARDTGVAITLGRRSRRRTVVGDGVAVAGRH